MILYLQMQSNRPGDRTFLSRGPETQLSNNNRNDSRIGAVLMPLENWNPLIRDWQFQLS
jgi:hypothetical protein